MGFVSKFFLVLGGILVLPTFILGMVIIPSLISSLMRNEVSLFSPEGFILLAGTTIACYGLSFLSVWLDDA